MKKVFAAVITIALCLTFILTLVGCASGCDHDYDRRTGICTKCGEKNPNFKCLKHSWSDGKCIYCGKEDSYTKGAEFKFTKNITIKFYSTMGANLKAVYDRYIADFQAMYPNITVEHTAVGGYDDVRDQIMKELMVKDGGPNVAYCYPDHVARYNSTGGVLKLDKYINSADYIKVPVIDPTTGEATSETKDQRIGFMTSEIEDFIPGFYNEGTQFGTESMFTLPFSKSTELMYYNKDIFAKHNLKVPTHWWCTDSCAKDCDTSLEYVLKALKKEYPDSRPLGYDSEANWFITMCEQLGSDYTAIRGEHYMFNNQTNRDFVAKFVEWYHQGLFTTQEINGNYTSNLFVADLAEGGKGNSFISIGSSAGATHQRPAAKTTKDDQGNDVKTYPFEVGIASIPQQSDNHRVISQGPSLCLFEKADEEANMAAWLFARYFTTNQEFQADFSSNSGYIPVLQSLSYDNLTYNTELRKLNVIKEFYEGLENADGGDNIAQLALKAALAQSDYYYTSPAFNGSSTARDQVGQLMVKCFSNIKVGDDIATAIKGYFDAAIAECKNAG